MRHWITKDPRDPLRKAIVFHAKTSYNALAQAGRYWGISSTRMSRILERDRTILVEPEVVLGDDPSASHWLALTQDASIREVVLIHSRARSRAIAEIALYYDISPQEVRYMIKAGELELARID